MGVDVERQVEHGVHRCVDLGDVFELDGHGDILPASSCTALCARAGLNPAKLLVAASGTAAWGVVAVLYIVAALVVPATYLLLLTIAAPVVVGALIQRHRVRSSAADGAG